MIKLLQAFKYTLVFSAVLFGFALFATPAHAEINCGTFESYEDSPPGLEQIICPVIRVINIFLYAAVAVLIIMLLFGGIKLALSFGDPKAFQAATGTWTWAIIGFLVVVGSFTLLGIIARFFGWGLNFTSPFEYIYNKIVEMNTQLFPPNTPAPTYK